jgi:uncharacterized protein
MLLHAHYDPYRDFDGYHDSESFYYFCLKFILLFTSIRMSNQIFINLPVKDVERSMALYTAMGFTNNPQFSDDNGKCMIYSENIFVMLLSHSKFSSFTTKPIADTQSHIAGLFSISLDSLEAVHDLMSRGLAAGASEPNEMRDYGFMQQRTLEDFDGHTWEFFFMDMSKM